jgi:hypothetical protein
VTNLGGQAPLRTESATLREFRWGSHGMLLAPRELPARSHCSQYDQDEEDEQNRERQDGQEHASAAGSPHSLGILAHRRHPFLGCTLSAYAGECFITLMFIPVACGGQPWEGIRIAAVQLP